MRYLSLYDNQFLRFFAGHTDKVVSIAMSPTDDHFMTGSLDRRETRSSRVVRCLRGGGRGARLHMPTVNGFGVPQITIKRLVSAPKRKIAVGRLLRLARR